MALEYNEYILSRVGCKVQKLSINAGSNCPNRDGTIGIGGCAFCNNESFNPSYCSPNKSIAQQITEGKAFFRKKYPEMKYLAYFQSYTNTYGDTHQLVSKYEEALSQEDVVGLVIGTRPDCLKDDMLEALRLLASRTYLCVELGAESIYDATLRRINRGHTWGVTQESVCRLSECGVDVGLHFIMGLPGESVDMQLRVADAVNALPVQLVKLHQLQIVRGSLFASQYEREELHDLRLWEVDEYIDFCVEFLSRLRNDIVVERFTSQAPSDMVVAPRWGLKNYEFTNRLRNEMKRRDRS
ncbi:MAG: TIGR01212 family radical SAM protein [Marinilabiliaceae bacterium]|nr:TIGR01212 family radical SAM protein [Marinilabiliaceae bacterium]